MARRGTVYSRYGPVDRLVLDELRQGFDTSRLLLAIAAGEASEAGQVGHPTLHSSLLCLHGMAARLIDGAPATIVSDQPIWQLAEEILDDIEASHAHLSDIVPLVERLADLRPGDD